jgi:hypothetical protein
MTKRVPPKLDYNINSLKNDSGSRHEELIDLFGQYVMWLRNRSITSTELFVESQEARERIGNIFREPYEDVAKLAKEDRVKGLRLANAAVDGFIVLMLQVLAHQGNDFDLGDKHCIRYKLMMEIVDKITGETVLEDVINRDGKKHFADYWGRWLNRYNVK